MNYELRKFWIDAARGYSMLAIYLFHTETYYAGGTIIDYGFYVENALACFFFVSGYLFASPDKEFSLLRKLRSVARHILLPYFIFTALLAVPKAVFHGGGIDVGDMLLTIVKGQASWFVAALAVAEVVFALLFALPSRHRRWALPAVSVVGYAASYWLVFDAMFLWYACVALMSLIFLYAGHLYRLHETAVDRHSTTLSLALGVAVLVAMKWFEKAMGWEMIYGPYCRPAALVFLADTLLSSLVIICLSKRFCSFSSVNFIGRHSLVWYFLAGGVPAVTSAVFSRLGLPYSGNYLMVLAVFAVGVTVVYLVTGFYYSRRAGK